MHPSQLATKLPENRLRLIPAYPVVFEPVCKERVWGGHRLKSWFSQNMDAPIGEYWLVSAHPAGPSVVRNGPFRGLTLDDLVRLHPRAYLGRTPHDRTGFMPFQDRIDGMPKPEESLLRRFPLLVKLIEAADHLSVQVHPDDAHALERERDFGKTEAWYILDPGAESEIIYGHRFESADHLLRSAREQTIGRFLERKAIRPDDLVYVPAGTVHAILKGAMLLEIQQCSDVTYRLYDWERKDGSGNSRELHLEQAVSVMRFGMREKEAARFAIPPTVCIADGNGLRHDRLLISSYFVIERLEAEAGCAWTLRHGKEGNPDVLIVLEGEGGLSWSRADMGTDGTIGGGSGGHFTLRKGDAVLVPAGLPGYRLHVRSRMKIIRTYY